MVFILSKIIAKSDHVHLYMSGNIIRLIKTYMQTVSKNQNEKRIFRALLAYRRLSSRIYNDDFLVF